MIRRRLIAAAICASALAGCFTDRVVTYLSPQGPGKLLNQFGVPRMLEMWLADAIKVTILAEASGSETEFTLVMRLNYGHVVTLEKTSSCYQCGQQEPVTVSLPTAEEWRLKNGVGYTAPKSPANGLEGPGYPNRSPKLGDVSVGEYTFRMNLPACAASFSVTVPRLRIDGVFHEVARVDFVPKTTRAFYFPPIS